MSYDNWKLRSDLDEYPFDEPWADPSPEEGAADAIEEHYRLARKCVRRSLAHDRQREFHAIYLNQDQVDYLRELAAAERVDAREHIRLAKTAEARLA